MHKVLVVDDSLSVRKVVERALVARGIDVLSAASGAEAVERVESETPDLVVCDVIMPDKDGYQICEWVKSNARFRHIPVLLISGIVNAAVSERAAAVRADDVLGKPFAAEDLLARIDRLLAARKEAPAAVTVDLMEDDDLGVPDLKKVLDRFVGMQGVRLAALVDREGFLIESTGDRAMPAELAAALAACLAESSSGIGRELNQGTLHGMLLEYENGIVSLHAAGPAATLVIVISDPPVLGKVRYYVKKALPELARVI